MKKIIKKIWIYLHPFLNIKFLICYCIATAWQAIPYMMIVFGSVFNNIQMKSIGLSIEAVLWNPFCREEFLVIPFTLFLNRVLFKNDDKSRKIIKDMELQAKEDYLSFLLWLYIIKLKIRHRIQCINGKIPKQEN